MGVPGWIVQRLWMSLLLVTAFLGVVRLAERLLLGSPTTRLLAGLAFALSPRIVTVIGGNSSEIWPMAVLPWVLLPLVTGERRPRTAAMRSGVAIFLMGAVNATAVLSVLVLPALWLLPGLRRAGGRRLAAWWVVAGALACAWWLVPLLLQGGYSPDFLHYIETASTTTSSTSASEVVRGTSHWLAYIAPAGQPWWRAGWTLVTNGGVVLDTALLAALGIVGLTWRKMPGQGRFVGAAAVGLVAMAAAHAGPLDGPLVLPLRHLLDGPLEAFRNVHKFDPLIRLPLALGLCHLLSLPLPGRPRNAVSALVAVALVGAASPALAGQLVPSGAYDRLPSWWQSTGTWLDAHDARGRALVVPASGFAEYRWGRPLDNPLQALATSAWAVRDAVPLGSPGTTRLLDAIDARLDTGHGSAAMATVLARSGVHYVVVSNDLDLGRTGAPRPVLVHQALADSPGLTRVASFGPVVGGDASRDLVTDDGLQPGFPAVEVYEVEGFTSPVTAMPSAATWVVSGGPESLFQLADRGLLGSQATVLAGDGAGGPSPRSALTDALRRREVNFGSVRDNASETLTATQPLRRDQAVPDILPVPGVQHLATARLLGAQAVSASSSASDPAALSDRGPAHRPFSAIDGDPRTSWVSGGFTGTTGQWLQLDLDSPVDPAGTTIQLLHDDQARAIPTVLTVRTDRGATRTQVRPGDQAQPLNVPAGTTRHLRVTFSAVSGDGFAVVAGVRELTIPGVHVQESVVLPQDQQQVDPVVLLDRAPGAQAACVRTASSALCSPDLTRVGEDVLRLDRTFSLTSAASLPLSGTAVPQPGAALDALLDKGSGVRVTATSRRVPDPIERPAVVLDGDPHTGWVAGDLDATPTLTLSWHSPRTVDRFVISTDPSLAAGRPTRVEVSTSRGTTSVDVPATGLVTFPAARITALEVRISAQERRHSFEPDGSIRDLPVGVSELSVPALADLVGGPVADDTPVTVGCGSAPPVVIDGVTHPTEALATRGDLVRLQPVPLRACDSTGGIELAAGQHRAVAADKGALLVQGLTLGSSAPSATAPAARTTTVTRWDPEHRVVELGAGDQSYLVVHENASRGWRAVLAGRVLQPARVDGWQQAWVVPAGQGGQVVLTFTPGKTFHLALVIGAVLVLLLLALALWPARAREPQPAKDLGLPRPVRAVLVLGVLVLVGGPVGAAIGLIVLASTVLVRHRGGPNLVNALSALLAAPLVTAGLLTALAPWDSARQPAAFGGPVQVLVLVALAAAGVLVSGLTSPSGVSGPGPAAPPDEG